MEVGNAAYESNWYNLSPLDTRLLILVMVRAKQPFIITAGKFAAFSLGLYCSVCIAIFCTSLSKTNFYSKHDIFKIIIGKKS